MTFESGMDLLTGYARRREEAAFEGVVSRYLGPVHSVALRRVGGDTALAAEVTQAVFADLARKALEEPMKLHRFHPLGGWLHRHACFLSSKAVRTEVRRKAREAAVPPPTPDESGEVWTAIAPWVDDAVEQLPDGTREALILRFYGQLDFQSIGAELGITDDAAQKRVSRALDRLRGLLEARGITSTASAIGSALGGHAVAVAPQSLNALLASIGRDALAGSIPAAPSAGLLVTTWKASLAGAAVLIAAGGAWIWHQDRDIRSLRAELTHVAAELDLAVVGAAASSNAWITATATLQAERAELLRLRGALAAMRLGANTENPGPGSDASSLTADQKESIPFDPDTSVTQVYVDPQGQRLADPVQIPATLIKTTKALAELRNVGTKSPVAAAETIVWATLHDAEVFSALVFDQSSMLGPGSKLDETEKIRSSFLGNLNQCTEVRFILKTQETWPIPGEMVSLALIQADREQPVMLSLKFIPAGDHWMLEQSSVVSGRQGAAKE